MDDFRKEQQKDCADGSPGQSPKYGCPCCRKIRNLRLFKKASRKWAKGRLRNKTSKFIRDWDCQY